MKKILKISNFNPILVIFAICCLLFNFSTSFAQQDFWNQTNGPEGGQITCVAVDANQNIFVGGWDGTEIYLSQNNGTTWTRLDLDIDSRINDIITNGNTIFVATRDTGVFRSTDNGNNWMPVNNGIDDYNVASIFYNQFYGSVFAGTMEGRIFKSNDNGNNWQEVNHGFSYNSDAIVNSFTANSGGDIFASVRSSFGTDYGVIRSLNNGVDWEEVNNGLSDYDVRDLAISNNDSLYAGTNDSGVFRSADNGDNWARVDTGFVDSRVYYIFVRPNNNQIFASSNYGYIYQSNDEGNTWISMNNGLPTSSFIWGMDVNSSGDLFAATYYDGLYKMDNGTVNWYSVNDGIVATSAVTLLYGSDGFVYTGTRGGDVLRGDANGITWTNLAGQGPSNTRVMDLIEVGANLFAASDDGIHRSPDVSTTWTHVYWDHSAHEMVKNSSNQIFCGNSNGEVIRSSDNGNTWTPAFVTGTDIYTLAINSGDTIYAGSQDNGIFVSYDGGINWNEKNNDLFGGALEIWSTALDANEDIYIGTADGLYFSDNDGDNWRQVFYDPSVQRVHAIAINSLGHIYIGGWYGMFRSIDGAETWEYVEGGLENNDVTDLLVLPDNHLLAGVEAAGVHRTTSPVILPGKPILNNPGDGNMAIPITSGFDWQPLTGAGSYNFQIAHDYEFTDIIYDEKFITGTGASITEAGLEYDIIYYWRIAAFDNNDIGVSEWSDVWQFQPAYSIPNLYSPGNGESNVQIDPNFNWAQPIDGADEYRLMIATDYEFNDVVMDIFNITTTNFTVYGLHFDTYYYWRVQADNQWGTSNWSDIWAFTIEPYPDNHPIDFAFDFPTHNNPEEYNTGDWRMYGFPGESGMSIASFLGPDEADRWKVFWDNGNDNNYFYEFDNSAIFNCNAGKGFWVIYMGYRDVPQMNINSAPINNNNEAEIYVHSGWNIITNPFLQRVQKWEIEQANGITFSLWEYDGTFHTSDFMDPYLGYYFDNNIGLTVLRIPYPSTQPKIATEEEPDWQVNLTLSTDDIKDDCNWIGISKDIESSSNKFNFRKPRAIGLIPSINIKNLNQDGKTDILARDIRSEIEDKELWNFEVNSVSREEATIAFSGIEYVPEKYDIYLLNLDKSKYLNLREEMEYKFIPVKTISGFRIVIGKPESVQEELENILPKDYGLKQNYPNPFNPVTSIPVDIKDESYITVKVYNILGQEIRTLFEGRKSIGTHYFQWNGTNQSGIKMPSGVYIYLLNVENVGSFTKKMILLK